MLVITGKGKIGAESERGVLRRQVPQWLSLPEFRSLVVGFEEAHIGHGGEGALYVRVRRVAIVAFRTAARSRRAESASRSSRDISGLSIISRYQRHALARPASVFTACRIRNMQTAQFEIQRE